MSDQTVTPSAELVISSVDYARLEPMIRDAVASGGVARDLLCALKSKLDRARVLEPSDMPADVVTMNSSVRVRDLATGEVDAYTLVCPAFADITQGRLSILTPVGVAILGHRQGDTLEEMSLIGSQRLQIAEVDFQPESAGRYDV